MRLADVAKIWANCGVSVIPIQPNATKRPAVRWGEYQVKAPDLGQVDEWWGNGSAYGIALICGDVSGNLEMLELEGRATSGEMVTEIINRCDELGVGHIWDQLNSSDGYSELSPSGGLHLLYRITDHEVPGNTKIARRPATEEELAQNPDDPLKVLAETRGKGGYVIVAPTPGSCHPSGEAWALLNGEYGTLPLVTWDERCRLHEALRLALDEPRPDQPSPTLPTPVALPVRLSATGLSPGDDFENRTDWTEILEPHGWVLESTSGRTRNWTRPGKDRRDGASATTGHAHDRDRFFVFTTSTQFKAEEAYTKFAVYTILNHGGNYHDAAVELKRRGYGERSTGVGELDLWDPGGQEAGPAYNQCEANDIGNTEQLARQLAGRFHYLAEEKDFICWDGVKWATDQRFRIEFEYVTMVRKLAQEARDAGDETWVKWWTRAGNRSRLEACIKGLRALDGFTVTVSELNDDRRVINVANGILELTKEAVLRPHDPSRRLTRVMDASYDPQATCPQFESFMERVLPDPGMRAYAQRALGYSMLGDADQRSLFLICGPSGTGKSTLMATMELVFGDYGVPAPPGTLRAAGREGSSPSNDLHMLRGKRFVSTSETNEHTAYNEDLIKRLTGRDRIQSRNLYKDFQDWSPVCAIWLATNHPPRFSSDDDAIWRRAKIIPFHTVLLGEGEVPDYAHNVLAYEKNGILNWLLAGLQDYLAHGLQEPEEVQAMAHEVRLQSDPVSRFLEDYIGDGILVRDQAQMIRSTELYTMYQDWARRLGERALGSRRFTNRVLSGYPDFNNTRMQGNYFWRGVGRSTGASVLGTFQGP